MARGVATHFEQSTGHFVLRCDTDVFERLLDAVCLQGGVFVPLSVPPTPVRALSIVLAEDVPPPRVSWIRQTIAVVLCVFLLCGPIGLIWLVRWALQL
jgi:hypothetical protein